MNPRAVTSTVLRPGRPGGLPLTLAVGALDHVPGCVLSLGVGDPPRWYDRPIPDCGCDACDSGSSDLLELIDDEVLTVVSGGFVYASGEGWMVRTTPGGWASSWSGGGAGPDAQTLIARVRAGEEVEGVLTRG